MLPKIIIIEGIDRVGKTTLAKMIAEEYGYKIFNSVNNNEEYRKTSICKSIETEKIYSAISVLKSIENSNYKIIFDRFHLSELVYGMLERNYINEKMLEIDKILAEMQSMLIYVKPIDISESIRKHKSDLTSHNFLFKIFYILSSIKKEQVDYNSIKNFVENFKGRI